MSNLKSTSSEPSPGVEQEAPHPPEPSYRDACRRPDVQGKQNGITEKTTATSFSRQASDDDLLADEDHDIFTGSQRVPSKKGSQPGRDVTNADVSGSVSARSSNDLTVRKAASNLGTLTPKMVNNRLETQSGKVIKRESFIHRASRKLVKDSQKQTQDQPDEDEHQESQLMPKELFGSGSP